MNKIKKITKMNLFLPIFCMILVMATNVIYDVACGNFAFSFFTISMRNGVLFGRIIDILNREYEKRFPVFADRRSAVPARSTGWA